MGIVSFVGSLFILEELQIRYLIYAIMGIAYDTIVIVFIVFSLRNNNPKRVVKGAIIWCVLQTVIFFVGFVQYAINGEDLEAIYSSVVIWVPVILPFVSFFWRV